jgi:nicotinamide mononucleotide (NMN) deamidase PncC
MSSDFRPPALASVADEVGQLLKSRKETLAIAEVRSGSSYADCSR